jgi:hypothetical protein
MRPKPALVAADVTSGWSPGMIPDVLFCFIFITQGELQLMPAAARAVLVGDQRAFTDIAFCTAAGLG